LIDPSVFVIDDDTSIREAVAGLVRSAGLKVRTFASAQELLARPPPDVGHVRGEHVPQRKEAHRIDESRHCVRARRSGGRIRSGSRAVIGSVLCTG